MLSIANLHHNCSFAFGLVDINNLPNNNLPQMVFWGRSNVGKSSIINAITNKKRLARVSNTPGRTQEINFFNIADSNNINKLYIVDLPGYGYAKISKTTSYEWSKTTEKYIINSNNLRIIYLLIDSKVGFKKIDLAVIDFLNYYGKLYCIVFTKQDKATKQQIEENTNIFNTVVSKSAACVSNYLITSVNKKLGIDTLQNNILGLINKGS